MTYIFRGTIRGPWIGFIEADSLGEALLDAAYLWRREHHKDKNGVWYDVLGGCIVELPDGGSYRCMPSLKYS